MTNRDTKSADYWQESYNLQNTGTLWGNDHVPFVDNAIDYFKTIDNGRFYIDLPCGDGRNLTKLCKKLPVVIGADSSVSALEISKERLSVDTIRNSLLHYCDIFNTGYLNDQFDGIFCWDLLGHLVNVEKAIDELLRIIKPGGILVGSLFTTEDSTIDDEKMISIGDKEFIYNDKFYFKYYDLNLVQSLLKKFDVTILYLKKATWVEGPHEGYREYRHNHESWAFVLQKV
jgi:ubiquinone/menaquinone biosynthesis C-methylase UbiE